MNISFKQNLFQVKILKTQKVTVYQSLNQTIKIHDKTTQTTIYFERKNLPVGYLKPWHV